MNNNLSLSIILPAYNEEDNIRKTIEDSAVFFEHQETFSDYEMIVVNDGSVDQTLEILMELQRNVKNLEIITHSQNLGYGEALTSGVKKARFPWILMMDTDGQFEVSSIESLIRHLPEYDIITGYRDKRRDSFYRITLGKMYTFLACTLFRLKFKDINCGFKLLRKEILDLNGTICHAGAFYTDIFLRAKQKGCAIKEVPVEHFSRTSGRQTGANTKVALEAVRDILRLAFFRKGKG